MNNPEENVDRDHGMTARPLMVADVMTQHVITLSPQHSFYDAMSLIAKRSFRHFLVVDEGGKTCRCGFRQGYFASVSADDKLEHYFDQPIYGL